MKLKEMLELYPALAAFSKAGLLDKIVIDDSETPKPLAP